MTENVDSLDTFIDPSEIERATNFSPSDLDSAMLRVAAEYAAFARKAALARRQRDFAESALEIEEAMLDKAIRDKIATEGKTKPAETAIAAQIKRTKRYAEAVKNLNEAEAIFEYCRSVCSAIEMKRDMLVQLNKNAQREWEYSSALTGTGGVPMGAIERFTESRKKTT